MRPANNRWLPLLSLALFGVIIYAYTLHSPYFLDDKVTIVENNTIRDLGNFAHPSQAKRFTGYAEYPMLVRRYVSMLSLALDYHFNGLDTTSYHIVNIIIHIFNTLLVYALVILTFRTPFMRVSRIAPYAPRAALLAGALFVAHPIQTQAVTYIVQRMASLATLFYLASLVSYIQSRLSEEKRQKIIFFIIALASAVLAMKSKEIAFTLPIAVALYEWLFLEGPIKKRIALWLPLGFTMLIIPLTQLALKLGGLGVAMSVEFVKMPRLYYLMTESRVLITYLRLLVAPLGQNLMYDYPIYTSVLNPNVLLSGLFHLGLMGLSIYLYRRSRKGEPVLRLLAFGIWWFYLSLAVESTLVPLHPIYEHRLYLTSAGVFTAVAAGGVLLYDQIRPKKRRTAMAILMIMAPLVLGGMAIARNAIWKTEFSLWQDVEKKAPASLFSHVNLANAYQKAGRHSEAIAEYQATLTLSPPYGRTVSPEGHHAEMYMHIGDSYRALGKTDEALEAYSKAVKSAPKGPYAANALNSIGAIYSFTGRNAEAVNAFIRSIKLAPNVAHTHFNLGLAYYKLGMKQDAVKAFQNSLQLDPGNQKAKNLLNLILVNGNE